MRAAPRSPILLILVVLVALGASAAAQNGGGGDGRPAGVKKAEGAKGSRPIRLDGVAARVEGQVITWNDVARQIGNVMKTMGFPSQAERERQLERIAYNKLSGLVVEELELKRARDEGVQVPPAAVEAAFERDMKTVGSPEEFEKVLAEQGLTVQDKKKQIHRRLLRVYYLESTRRKTPWSKAIRAYTLQVRPSEMRDFYKKNLETYRERAAVWVRKAHVSAAEQGGPKKAEALALKAVDDLNKGMSPAEVDAKYGLGADQFTCSIDELDPIHRDSGFLREVLDWAFASEAGAVYGPKVLRGTGDCVIFFLEKRRKEVVRSFAEVQDEIRVRILNQIYARFDKQIRQSLTKRADIEPRELKAFMLGHGGHPRMSRDVLVALLRKTF